MAFDRGQKPEMVCVVRLKFRIVMTWSCAMSPSPAEALPANGADITA